MWVKNIGLFYVWKVYQWTASLWWSVCRELCSVWMQTGVWICDSYVMCCSDVLLLKATVNKCYLQTGSQRYMSLFKEVDLWKLLLQRVFSTMYTWVDILGSHNSENSGSQTSLSLTQIHNYQTSKYPSDTTYQLKFPFQVPHPLKLTLKIHFESKSICCVQLTLIGSLYSWHIQMSPFEIIINNIHLATYTLPVPTEHPV